MGRSTDFSNDAPALVVGREQLVGIDGSPSMMMAIPGSRMFEIKEALKIFNKAQPDATMFDASQGDGGASLSGVPVEVLEKAAQLQIEHGTGYDKPFGTDAFRRAVVEDYWQLDSTTGWGPTNIIAAQGGRDALLKAYDAVQFLGHQRHGDFVVASRVPWVSYNWGPYAMGANVMLAPGLEDQAWALTPESAAQCVDEAARYDGRKVSLLVVTSPDNPTGRSITLEDQVLIGKSAFAAGIPFVLFDWIYHRVTDEAAHDLNRFLNAFDEREKEGIIILDGLTKSLGASNIRNAHLVADEKVVRFIQSRASHGVIPTFHSQAVAIAAYTMGYDRAAASIVGPTNESRRVLSVFLVEKKIRHIIGKGYYAFLDLGPWLDKAGLDDTASLGTRLAEEFGIAIVPGAFFSRYGKRWIRFSYALTPKTTRLAANRLWEALESI